MNDITGETPSPHAGNSTLGHLDGEINETEMNDVEMLERDLHARFPSATLTMDTPSNPGGTWYVDVRNEQKALMIQWAPDRGFGLSAVSGAYGEGADEVYETVAQIENRVIDLLSSESLGSSRVDTGR